MHEQVLKADFVLECGTSDQAPGAIATTSPCGSATGAKFYRRLRADETEWSSVLRELTAYRVAFLALSRSVDLAGRVTKIIGDSLCCKCIWDNGGGQVVDVLSRFVDRMDFSLRSNWREHLWRRLRPLGR